MHLGVEVRDAREVRSERDLLTDADGWIGISPEEVRPGDARGGAEQFTVRATHPEDTQRPLKRRRVMTLRVPADVVERVTGEESEDRTARARAMVRDWNKSERRPGLDERGQEVGHWASAVRFPERETVALVSVDGGRLVVHLDEPDIEVRVPIDRVRHILDGGA